MSAVNAPPSQTTGESNSVLATASRASALIKDVGPWFYAVVVSALYVFGFLVLNSNLAKRGILDVEFVEARYFLAGINFAFFVLCFYLFAGRTSIFTPRWLNEEYESTNRDVTKPPWKYVAVFQSYVAVIFSCCLSSALFISIAISNRETLFFYTALGGAFVVLNTFDVNNLDLKFPRAYVAVTICAKLAAILAFFLYQLALFLYQGDGLLIAVFFTYLVMFLLIYRIVQDFTRRNRTADSMVFSGLYTIVILISIAIAFGTLFYGRVTLVLGGAKPQAVSISLSTEARKALPAFIPPAERQRLEGMLIHQTTSHTYIEMSGRTVRLRTADVVALVIAPEPPWQFLRGFIEEKRDTPKAP
jgi:hypothetical protein